MLRRPLVGVLVGFILGASCAGPQAAPLPGPQGPAKPRFAALRGQWDSEELRGISGLCKSSDGRYLAVPERVRKLFPFTMDARGHTPHQAIPITGVPEGVDLESIACLPEGRLAFGTEVQIDGRDEDAILLAQLGTKVEVEKATLRFDYRPFSISASRNRGVEALCYAQGLLLAASEQIGEHEGRRFAPLGVYDWVEKRWRYARLLLSSKTGKVSGMTCQRGARGVEVVAIERHYEVVNLLRFDVALLAPAGEALKTVRPEVLQELGPQYPDSPPNFEGLAFHSRALLLIADNDYGGKSGPTELLVLEPARRYPAGYSGSAR